MHGVEQESSRVPRSVLLTFGGAYYHNVHAGVARYAREHGWHLYADVGRKRSAPHTWHGDGVISYISDIGGDVTFERQVAQCRIPLVNIGLVSHAHLTMLGGADEESGGYGGFFDVLLADQVCEKC